MAGGEALYERYKDALKRGHVASLRGRLDEALDAYAEASSIAPERPTPHSSAGTALLRRRRFGDALRYFEAALTLGPRDEASLLGRAQALAGLDRRPEAADAFDALADQRAAAGKLPAAVDAARRGLELAEGRDRRRTLERLIARLRVAEPDEPARAALERALLVLDPRSAAHAADPGSAARGAPGAAAHAAAGGPVDRAPSTDGSPGGARPGEAGEMISDAGSRGAPAVPSPLDRDVPPDADLDALSVLADAALDAGDASTAVERLLDLAAASRLRGHGAAAIDACYVGLSLAPDHVGLHLALVELYGTHGWSILATEKLDLLERLVLLNGDDDAAARVAAARPPAA